MKIIPLALGLIVVSCVVGAEQPAQPAAKKAPAAPGLTLTTSAFADGGIIPPKYTQAVSNPLSPKLEWTNARADVLNAMDGHVLGKGVLVGRFHR